MPFHIGTGPDSWGVWFPDDPKQTPWTRYLDEAAESGYEWTELGPYGYLPTNPTQLRRELDQRGLKVCGSFAMAALEDPLAWPDLDTQVLGTGELLAATGASFLVLIDGTYSDLFTGDLITGKELDEDNWKRLIDKTHETARLAREKFDLTLVFHPHAETHVEYEPQIERLLEDTDPSLVALCLDTGHHAYRGGNAVAFMKKHHERIKYLHLKSVDADKQKQVEVDRTTFAHAVAQNMFCEPSAGVVDFLAFRDLLQELEFEGFGVVEQDMYPAPFDKPLPIAKRTRDYLRDIGLG